LDEKEKPRTLPHIKREEAEKERDRLSREHPEATWFVRQEADGVWSVVKANVAQTPALNPTAETQADERPPQPDDTRSGHIRRVGGNFA
jgi:hypothetical protein